MGHWPQLWGGHSMGVSWCEPSWQGPASPLSSPLLQGGPQTPSKVKGGARINASPWEWGQERSPKKALQVPCAALRPQARQVTSKWHSIC